MIRTQMEIAQEWFQFVDQYWWTPTGIKNPPTLSPSVETVMEMLEESWDLGDPDRAWSEIERVTKKRLEMSNTETAVATKLCGQILLAMQNREGTERLIRQALISMPRSEKHMVAVLTWMYGIIQWLRPGRHTEAINDWKESISLFYEISRDPATGMNKKNWYIAQLRIMRDALRKAIREDQLPPLGGVQGIFVPIPVPRKFGGRAPKDEDEDEDEEDLREFESPPEPPDTPEGKIELPEELERQLKPKPTEEPPPEEQEEEPEQQEELQLEAPPKEEKPSEESPEKEQIRDIHMIPLPENDQPEDDENGMIPIDDDILPPGTSPVSQYVQEFLELVQVQDEIITGEFDDIEQTSDMPFVEVSIVRIDYKDYNINFLGKWAKKRSINIYGKEFYFLKTKGKSMNAAGIEDGDYVLIRKQTTAENGDIVAAGIRDEDDPQRSKATLKKFLTAQGDGKNKKNLIILKAVSHEEEFEGKEWPFSPEQQNEEDGFSIHGVVVAILKPIKKKT